jgi:hypothetical protein
MQHVARFVVWPVVVTLALAGYAFGFASGRPFVTLMLVPVAISVLLLPLEEWLPAVPRAALRDPQLPQDLLHAVLGQDSGTKWERRSSRGDGDAAGLGRRPLGLALWPADWPMALQILVGVFVVDGLSTPGTAAHCFAWLWRAHALHHSADRMHV